MIIHFLLPYAPLPKNFNKVDPPYSATMLTYIIPSILERSVPAAWLLSLTCHEGTEFLKQIQLTATAVLLKQYKEYAFARYIHNAPIVLTMCEAAAIRPITSLIHLL